MTGQGILLVGMMTEAVVTPLLSDRDLALQNVRYVLDAAGRPARGLPPAARRLHPAARASQVLGEAVELLERDRRRAGQAPLLDAIARRHVRPDEAPGRPGQGPRRRRAPRAPATSTRPPTCWRRADAMTRSPGRCTASRQADRPAVRRHHRRRHGAGVVHAADRRTTSAPRAPRCSSPPRWAWTRPWSCTPSRWGRDFTFFVVYGSVTHLVDLSRGAGGRARVPAADRQGGQRRRSRRGCGASWSSSARASAPTRTPSASTRSSTSRASRGRRAWSTTARSRW